MGLGCVGIEVLGFRKVEYLPLGTLNGICRFFGQGVNWVSSLSAVGIGR